MSKIAQVESNLDTPAAAGADQLTRTARAPSETVADAPREFARTATAIADDQRATARHAASEAGDIGRTVAELLAEQTRHSVDAVAVMGRAVDWAELAQAQHDFFAGSFARMRQFNDRYCEAMLSGLKSMSVPARL